MKILVFGAFDKSESNNRRFIISVSKYYKEKEDIIEILNLNDYATISVISDSKIDEKLAAISDKIKWADIILMSIENNDGIDSKSYLNLSNWLRKVNKENIFQNKPVFLLSTSDEESNDLAFPEEVKETLLKDNVHVLDLFLLPAFSKNFEDGKGVITPLYRSQLEAKVRKTKRTMATILLEKQQ